MAGDQIRGSQCRAPS